MRRTTKWGLILGVWGAVLLSGADASAETPAAVKASPALIAQAAKRVASVVAVQSVQQFGGAAVAKSILDNAVRQVRGGVRLDGTETRDRVDSVHLRVKPRAQGAALTLQYRF